MTVTLSKTADEIEKVNKDVYDEINLPCELVNTDVLNPILKVEGTNLPYNYCYIAKFSRYYWVTKYESLAGGHLLVYCEVDPLMSYKDSILDLSVIVKRNKDASNSKVVDDKIHNNINSVYSSETFGKVSCKSIRYLMTVK